MITELYAKDRGVPPRLPQDVIDEIIERPREKLTQEKLGNSEIIRLLGTKPEIFYSQEWQESLERAIDFARDGGCIATLPMLIALMAQDYQFDFGSEVYMPYSEMVAGETKSSGKVVLILHGCGILKPKATFPLEQISRKKLEGLVKGKLPNGIAINISSLNDIKKGNVKDPFERYGVLLSEHETRGYNSEGYYYPEGYYYHKKFKLDFLKDPFVLASAGTPEYLEAFFDKSQNGAIINLGNDELKQDVPESNWMELVFRGCCRFRGKPALFMADPFKSKGRYIAVNPNKEAPK